MPKTIFMPASKWAREADSDVPAIADDDLAHLLEPLADLLDATALDTIVLAIGVAAPPSSMPGQQERTASAARSRISAKPCGSVGRQRRTTVRALSDRRRAVRSRTATRPVRGQEHRGSKKEEQRPAKIRVLGLGTAVTWTRGDRTFTRSTQHPSNS